MKLIKTYHWESKLSVVRRYLRSLWRSLNRPNWANHYCCGSHGNGEWTTRVGMGTRCYYCNELLTEKEARR